MLRSGSSVTSHLTPSSIIDQHNTGHSLTETLIEREEVFIRRWSELEVEVVVEVEETREQCEDWNLADRI